MESGTLACSLATRWQWVHTLPLSMPLENRRSFQDYSLLLLEGRRILFWIFFCGWMDSQEPLRLDYPLPLGGRPADTRPVEVEVQEGPLSSPIYFGAGDGSASPGSDAAAVGRSDGLLPAGEESGSLTHLGSIVTVLRTDRDCCQQMWGARWADEPGLPCGCHCGQIAPAATSV